MNAPGTPSEQAVAAAEAIRRLNHDTFWPGDARGYEWPGDVDDVVSGLQILVDRLPQALQQAERWLTDAAGRGLVGHDAGADAVQAVADAARLFGAAQQELTRLAHDLRLLRDITSHLSGVTRGSAGG
jgi:hypothetical protein